MGSSINRKQSFGAGMKPERVVLGVSEGIVPSIKPPVRIFLGTQPAQYRAERIFVWSIEQVRDPSRVYEIYLMKDLSGFDRNLWLTGFTNYRFAIPYFAGGAGRAIWNDVDQIYLADPGELFDLAMGEHGFLAISPDSRTDTAVMLMDCARMAPIWTLEEAQHKGKNFLIGKALAVPGLRGDLAPEWHARDEEYVPGRSKLLHYTVLHTQPWRPLPGRFVYQDNPVGHVWFDLERSADNAGYQVFSSARPSAQYTALLERLRAAQAQGDRPHCSGQPMSKEEREDLTDLVAEVKARTILDYRLSRGDDRFRAPWGVRERQVEQTVTHYDPACSTLIERPSGQFDGAVCTRVLEYLPEEDVPWVIEELFGYGHRFVYATVVNYSRTRVLPDGTQLRTRPRDPAWWYAHFESAAARHPEVHWELVLSTRTAMGRKVAYSRWGGRCLGGPPVVWVLNDDKPGHTTQSIALAEALGWPYEVKELHFTGLSQLSNHLLGATQIGLNRTRSAPLAPPWPDLVIATGRRPAPVARWIRRQSMGRSRLVQLGRKGGDVAEWFDLVVTPTYHRLSSHPHRIETMAPLNSVSPERLAQASECCGNVFRDASHLRVMLLVGEAHGGHQLGKDTARRVGKEMRAFARASSGSVVAVTSGGTTAEVIKALRRGLGESIRVYGRRPGEQETLYLACLGQADAIVVIGENDIFLAEAAASGKPVYVFPLAQTTAWPEATGPGLGGSTL